MRHRDTFSVQKHVPLIVADYPGKPMKAGEIARMVFERFREQCEVKRGRAISDVSTN